MADQGERLIRSGSKVLKEIGSFQSASAVIIHTRMNVSKSRLGSRLESRLGSRLGSRLESRLGRASSKINGGESAVQNRSRDTG